jgi:hypothetical protein
MAAIDKTYVNYEEYLKIRQFWIDTAEEQKKIFGRLQWLYPFQYIPGDTKEIYKRVLAGEITEELEAYKGKENFPVWNTSTMFDIWLIKRCNIPVVQNRLKSVYGENWWPFKYDLDFTSPCCILRFDHISSSSICYFFRKANETKIELLENILVYGTTEFFRHYDNVYNILFGVRNNEEYTIYFNIFGQAIEYKNGKYYIEEEEIKLGYLNTSGWALPSFIHSYDLIDADDFKYDEIILSTEKEFYDLMQFKNYKNLSVKGFCFRQLPKYIYNLIK